MDPNNFFSQIMKISLGVCSMKYDRIYNFSAGPATMPVKFSKKSRPKC